MRLSTSARAAPDVFLEDPVQRLHAGAPRVGAGAVEVVLDRSGVPLEATTDRTAVDKNRAAELADSQASFQPSKANTIAGSSSSGRTCIRRAVITG